LIGGHSTLNIAAFGVSRVHTTQPGRARARVITAAVADAVGHRLLESADDNRLVLEWRKRRQRRW
jgi:hypothetical protein